MRKRTWWRHPKLKPIYKSDGDGQRSHYYFARKVDDYWEYAIVEITDDGYLTESVVLSRFTTEITKYKFESLHEEEEE